MNPLLFFAGIAAYYKLEEVLAERETAQTKRELALIQLRARAEQLQQELEDMQFDQTLQPSRHSAKQLCAARQRADRAQEALLMAEAGSTLR
ncbi:hypothetical protein HNP33_003492 [Comamonas odontotermitis]|uniref:Uncharacterized protein n=1 Tax=Comamonas odontotermitis TaxID=379895 RepID=A0ABR6RJM9_9BURK|nr:hypothetical protein [Comamonas odontotermitis]MBB6579380.1 hypothetical protein [Comamonas odontotermitis]